jgi:3-carboxy-cis,cis-muconate cycloisomerase
MATLLSGMVQEHERALGGWQSEWGALPELVKDKRL